MKYNLENEKLFDRALNVNQTKHLNENNYLNESERATILSQIDDINLVYNIKSDAIRDNILYVFLYQSNFYYHVEIDERMIYSIFNDFRYLSYGQYEDETKDYLNEMITEAISKLFDKKILIRRRYADKTTYILNNDILNKN